jgi:hypothetical protein
MNDANFLRDLADRLLQSPDFPGTDAPRLREIADKLVELDERDTLLTALENGGVNNWEWFDASLEDAGL